MEASLALAQAKYWQLRQIGWFAALSEAEMRHLVSLADLRLLPRGASVYQAGDQANQVYVVRTGMVRLFRALTGEREAILDFAGPGDLFGEASVAGTPAHQDGAVVHEDAFVCAIDATRFLAWVRQHPEIALQLLRVTEARRLEAERRAVELLTHDVRSRLAQTLVQLGDRFGVKAPEGIRIDLRLTQSELAAWIGSTRETTSMAFNDFRRRGWVDAADRYVSLKDREALLVVR